MNSKPFPKSNFSTDIGFEIVILKLAYLVLFESLPRGNRGATRVAVHAEPVPPEAVPDEGGLRVLHLVGRPPRPPRPLPPSPGSQLGQLDGVGDARRRRRRRRGRGLRRGRARRERYPQRRGRRGRRHLELGADGARPQVVDRLGLIPPPLPPPRVVVGVRLRGDMEGPLERILVIIALDIDILA